MPEFEPVLLARIDKPDSHVAGGVSSRRRLSRRCRRRSAMTPADGHRSWSRTAGLRGRGGAGFPRGLKWTFLPKDHPGPIYLCVNADESEPGTFNNRILMEEDPHQVLEGIIIACYAIAVARRRTSICATNTAAATACCEQAIDECYAAGLLGKNILGSGFRLDIYLHRGAGGVHLRRRDRADRKPRRQAGLAADQAAVPGRRRRCSASRRSSTTSRRCAASRTSCDRGVDWFKSIGVPPDPNNPRDPGSYGPKLYCISGHVNKPGCVELPLGITCRRADRRARRRRVERPQGEGRRPRRHQHGLSVGRASSTRRSISTGPARSAAWAWARRRWW